nr:MAG TPA: hypothetical protein [Caudoviricetes sp.]
MRPFCWMSQNGRTSWIKVWNLPSGCSSRGEGYS